MGLQSWACVPNRNVGEREDACVPACMRKHARAAQAQHTVGDTVVLSGAARAAMPLPARRLRMPRLRTPRLRTRLRTVDARIALDCGGMLAGNRGRTGGLEESAAGGGEAGGSRWACTAQPVLGTR